MTDVRSNPSTSKVIDYAIVGAGVSGLYTAWRLVCDDPKAEGLRSTEIFEASDRAGGRLLTWMPMGPRGGLRAELGGMRFFKEQELVCNLLKELAIADGIIDFPVDSRNSRLLLRGRSTKQKGADPTTRYSVRREDKERTASYILQRTIEKVLFDENAAVLDRLPEGMPRNRKEWDKIKPDLKWHNKDLWNVGFWNVLADSLSSETYQYICDSYGYYSLAANWNAAEAMQDIALDYTIKPDYKTLAQGLGELPRVLAKQVKAAGCKIHLKTRLVKIERLSHGGPWRLHLKEPTREFTRDANNLVLALPRRSLELLAAPDSSFDLGGNPELKHLIQSVTPVPAFKLFLLYKSRWWEELKDIKGGRSVCDLPIRQTYYFAPDPMPEDDPQAAAFGLLMASYSDARAVDFWRGLPPDEKKDPTFRDLVAEFRRIAAQFKSLRGPTPPPKLHLASQEMVRHATAQLALLHRVAPTRIPDPVYSAFADWGVDPIGGGWNFWEPNVNVRKAMEGIKIPLGSDQRLYIVGEAYSGAQGWVEGALTTVEKTIQTYIRPGCWPSWLPEGYYLGW
jgi:monoamine oxidase